MTVRRPAPFFLALGAALAGLISIVSALTPEFADRYDLVRGVLPPGLPEAARVVALAFGIDCTVVRILDPARAEFYRQRGLRTVCPTSTAIDVLTEAVRSCEIRREPEEVTT